MSYHLSKIIDLPHDKAIARVTEVLAANKMGVLTTIDVKATVKKKLDKDLRAYTILGACSPSHAFNAIEAERYVGTMLPCSMIVQDTDDGKSEVSVIDPTTSLGSTGNETVAEIGEQVLTILKKVIADL